MNRRIFAKTSVKTFVNACVNVLFFVLVAIVAASPLALFAASELTVSPQIPPLGSTVTFRYKPDSLYLRSYETTKQLSVFAYRFSESASQPNAVAVPLRKQGTGKDAVWVGELKLQKTDVYLTYKISNLSTTLAEAGRDAASIREEKIREDKNGGLFWETFVSADGAKPVDAASLRAGLTWLGNLPEQCNRTVDLTKALALFRKELDLYPSNRQAQIAEASLAFELRDIDEKAHRERVQKILAAPFDTTKEHHVRAMVRFLNTQNKAEEGRKIEELFIARYPTSEVAQEYAYRQVTIAQSEAAFFSGAKKYIASFPETYAAYELQGHVMGVFARAKKLDSAALFLQEQKYPSAVGYNELAKAWLWSDTSRQSGLEYAQKAVQLASNPIPQHKPTFLTDIEWQRDARVAVPITLNTLGAIYFQLKRDDDALAQFRRALAETGGKGGPDTYLMMISVLNKQGRVQESYELSKQAVINLPRDTSVGQAHRSLFDTLNPKAGKDGFLKERLKLVDSARTLRLQALSVQRLNQPPVNGTLTRPDGMKTSIAEVAKGRVAVVAFWASWCSTCLDALTQVNVLLDKYDQKATAIGINVWEPREKDRLKEARAFLKKRPYPYPILVDEKDEMVKAFGVLGLPTFYVLDKLGRVQFKQTGFNDPLNFSDSMDELIDIVLQDSFYKDQP